jgi:hypothetical protein
VAGKKSSTRAPSAQGSNHARTPVVKPPKRSSPFDSQRHAPLVAKGKSVAQKKVEQQKVQNSQRAIFECSFRLCGYPKGPNGLFHAWALQGFKFRKAPTGKLPYSEAEKHSLSDQGPKPIVEQQKVRGSRSLRTAPYEFRFRLFAFPKGPRGRFRRWALEGFKAGAPPTGKPVEPIKSSFKV